MPSDEVTSRDRLLFTENEPAISVVMPVYNKVNEVGRAIQSVLSQTFQDFEFLIVCDPSSDGSSNEVARYSDPRIRVFERAEPGPGGYAARNLGIREGRARWIAFLDADDAWNPWHLERMTALHGAFPDAGMLSCGWEISDGTRVRLQPYYRVNRRGGSHTLGLSEYLKNQMRDLRFCNPSVAVVRKDLLERCGGFPEGRARKGGDLYLFVKLFAMSTGAWSPHIGAQRFSTGSNQVTTNEVFNPVLFRDLRNELDGIISDCEHRLVDAYIARLLLKEYLRVLQRKGSRPFPVREHLRDFPFAERARGRIAEWTPAVLARLGTIAVSWRFRIPGPRGGASRVSTGRWIA